MPSDSRLPAPIPDALRNAIQATTALGHDLQVDDSVRRETWGLVLVDIHLTLRKGGPSRVRVYDHDHLERIVVEVSVDVDPKRRYTVGVTFRAHADALAAVWKEVPEVIP